MAAIISALNIVENGQRRQSTVNHQYGCTKTPVDRTKTQELIVQFNFQCVRTDKTKIASLALILRGLLQVLSNQSLDESAKDKDNLRLLYALIGQTRDVIDGKGEYTLAYMMILTWYEFFPELAVFALRSFVSDEIHTQAHPYGSWKDIKYLCAYIKDQTKDQHHPLIHQAIDIMNEQLRTDSTHTTPTLAGKWVARQGNVKFGWLFKQMAERYFPQYIESAKNVPLTARAETLKKASLKSRTEYRKLCSTINRRLDTIQIKQCANEWSHIDHSKTTSITVTKQKKAVLNVTKKGDQRSDTEDRIQCAENFKAYIETLKTEVKGARVGMVDFTKSGLELLTPWSLLTESLEKPRYDVLRQHIV